MSTDLTLWILISVYASITGSIGVIFGIYQISLHRKYPERVGTFQRIGHPIIVVVGLLLIAMAIDLDGQRRVYPIWAVVLWKDIITILLVVNLLAWISAMATIISTCMSPGFIKEYIKLICKVFVNVLLLLIPITGAISVLLDSHIPRIIARIYLSIVLISCCFLMMSANRSVIETKQSLVAKLSTDDLRIMFKFRVFTVFSFIAALLQILRVVWLLRNLEPLSSMKFPIESTIILVLFHSLGVGLSLYGSWIRVPLPTKPGKPNQESQPQLEPRKSTWVFDERDYCTFC